MTKPNRDFQWGFWTGVLFTLLFMGAVWLTRLTA